jgi:NAD(P)-dependent dehydrogenase (short-subunit alcohol dehydrogenase family)
MELSGRVAVVIGGTSGIGRALSLGLADAGADVVPCARTRDAVDATASEIEAKGRRTLRVTADVTDRRSLEAASFISGEIIAVDGGFLASGVNQ